MCTSVLKKVEHVSGVWQFYIILIYLSIWIGQILILLPIEYLLLLDSLKHK